MARAIFLLVRYTGVFSSWLTCLARSRRWLRKRGQSAKCIEESKQVLHKVLELYPQSGLLQGWLGCVLLAQGRLESARVAMVREVHDFFRRWGLALVDYARE